MIKGIALALFSFSLLAGCGSTSSNSESEIVAVTDFSGNDISARYNCKTNEMIRDSNSSIAAEIMPAGEWFTYADFERKYYAKNPNKENAPMTFNLWLPEAECKTRLGEDWYRGFEFF